MSIVQLWTSLLSNPLSKFCFLFHPPLPLMFYGSFLSVQVINQEGCDVLLLTPAYCSIIYLVWFISFQVQGFFSHHVCFSYWSLYTVVWFLQRNNLDHPFIIYWYSVDDKIKTVANGSICRLYMYIPGICVFTVRYSEAVTINFSST